MSINPHKHKIKFKNLTPIFFSKKELHYAQNGYQIIIRLMHND
jgi:hypothetical protein